METLSVTPDLGPVYVYDTSFIFKCEKTDNEYDTRITVETFTTDIVNLRYFRLFNVCVVDALF
jgi:hypothetical protein